MGLAGDAKNNVNSEIFEYIVNSRRNFIGKIFFRIYRGAADRLLIVMFLFHIETV